MRDVPDAWLRSMGGSVRIVGEAVICDTYQTGPTPIGTTIPVIGGDVMLDGTAKVRSTMDVATPGHDMWPTAPDSVLAPYGNEVFVRAGLKLRDDLTVWAPLGYHQLDDLEQLDHTDQQIRLSGQDRMAGLTDLVTPRQYGPLTSVGFIVDDLVLSVYPAAVIVWDDPAAANTLINTTLIADRSRVDFIDPLITALGRVWYWDGIGQLRIRKMPSTTQPVAELVAGQGGIVLTQDRRMTRRGVYNIVIASGEQVDEWDPVSAVAYDDDPNSPTYYLGKFGPQPFPYTDPAITTPQQARAAAALKLSQVKGIPYQADLTYVPNPALEPWDPITVRDSVTGATETHTLQTLTIPFGPATAMSATTRQTGALLPAYPPAVWGEGLWGYSLWTGEI